MSKLKSIATAALIGSLGGCFPRLPVSIDGSDTSESEVEESTSLPEIGDTEQPVEGDTGTEDVDTGDVPLELIIDTISPAAGTTAGGQSVELSGGPFDETAEVSLCGTVADVLAFTESSLVFETPPNLEGACDLRVNTDDGEGQRSDAFTYWADAWGSVIALASWTRTDLANPDHWSAGSDSTLRVDAAVVSARDVTLEELYTPGWDSCQRTDGDSRQAQWSALGSVNAGPSVISGSAATPVEVPWDASLGFYEEFLEAEVYEPGQRLVLTYGESAMYPAFEAVPTYRAPTSFRVTQPAVHGASVPWAYADNLDIRWTGGAADYVGIDIWSLSTSQRVRCVVEDDGLFEVPAWLLSDFPQDWVELVVSRYETEDVTMEFNDGLVRSQVGFAITGVVYIVR
jgi:hypothetical protein